MGTHRGITRGSLPTPILEMHAQKLGNKDRGIHRAVQIHLEVNWRCERIDRYELAMTIYRRIIPQVIKEVALLEGEDGH